MTTWRKTTLPEIPDSPAGLGADAFPWRSSEGKWLWSDGTDWYLTDTLGPEVLLWSSYDEEPEISTLQSNFKVDETGYRFWFTSGSTPLCLSRVGDLWVLSYGIGSRVGETWIQGAYRKEYIDSLEQYRVYVCEGYDDSYYTSLGLYDTSEEADTAGAEWVAENSFYDGDSWYSSSSFEGPYLPRGNKRGKHHGYYCGARKFISWRINGYRRKSSQTSLAPAGEYEEYERTVEFEETEGTHPDDETCLTPTYAKTEIEESNDPGDRVYVGLPRFRDNLNTYYTKALDGETYPVTSQGYYSRGAIWHDGTGWLMGTRNSASGWYEGSEPNLDSPVVFTRQKTDEGEYPGPVNLTVTFTDYFSIGENTKTVYLGEVGLWL